MKEKRILLIRKAEKDIWELPGGAVKKKGDEETTAVEKTEEQIGVTPTIIQYFTVLEYQKEGQNIEATIFESEIESEEFRTGENIAEIKWFDIAKLAKEKIGDDVKEILEGLSEEL